MTNQETIEKLNDALNRLIDAYEVLQKKHDEANETINDLIAKNRDLEFQLSDVNTTIDKRENKMDGMLNKIHKLLSSPKDDSNTKPADFKVEFNDSINTNGSILDIKLDDNKTETKQSDDKSNKIDLGRMESLLNGLNK
jgi:chromosome segregation ATPase